MASSVPTERFQAVQPLGAGGMGEVWLVRDQRAPGLPLVALKRLHPGFARDPELVSQFNREARIGSLLRHDNVVGLLDHGEDEQGPYLVLEYVEGLSALTLIRATAASERVLPLEVALSVLTDAVRGLHYAHGIEDAASSTPGVIHRDLSPDNILIDREGRAKLADFGIARMADSTRLTKTGTVKGKLGFLAPELFEGSPADLRTEVFALAAVAFNLLCGVRPFNGKTEAEQLHAMFHSRPPRLEHLRPDVPAGVAQWVHAALDREPSARPESLAALLEELERLRPSVELARRAVATYVQTLALPSPEAPLLAAVPAARRTPAVAPRSGRLGIGLGVGTLLLATAVGALAWSQRHLPATPPLVVPHQDPPPTTPPPLPVVVPPPQRMDTLPPTAVPATAPVATAHGKPTTLWVKVTPWAQVFLDGSRVGMTPLSKLNVAPGKHTVILVNTDLEIRRTYPLLLRAHESRVLKVDLQHP